MMPGACTGSCYSRGCNCYRLAAVQMDGLKRMQQVIHAEIVMRLLGEVMVMEGFTRGPDGTLISPDGKVILAP